MVINKCARWTMYAALGAYAVSPVMEDLAGKMETHHHVLPIGTNYALGSAMSTSTTGITLTGASLFAASSLANPMSDDRIEIPAPLQQLAAQDKDPKAG